MGHDFFVSSPIIFYQLWKFIAPGLYDKEKKIARPRQIYTGDRDGDYVPIEQRG